MELGSALKTSAACREEDACDACLDMLGVWNSVSPERRGNSRARASLEEFMAVFMMHAPFPLCFVLVCGGYETL